MQTPNLLQLQKQLESVDDRSLRSALQNQQSGPQFLVMLELDRRGRMRGGQTQMMSRPTTIREEMLQDQWEPVPPPSVPPPEQGGLAAMLQLGTTPRPMTPMAQQQPQQMQQMQRGIGSLT